jgi:hypothetical protein
MSIDKCNILHYYYACYRMTPVPKRHRVAWWSQAPRLVDAARSVPLSVVAILLLELLHPSLQIGMLTDLPDEITERGPLTV